MRRPLAALAVAALAGCTVPPPGQTPIAEVRGPVPVRTTTPLDGALGCLREAVPGAGRDLRFAVFSIPDRTGVVDYDGPGSYVTQGAELMMITALAKLGVRQVNRTATQVAEWELGQAMQKRLGDGYRTQVGDQAIPYRPIGAGVLLGSTHTIYGAITELDFDLQSDGSEVSIAGVGAKARGYYIGIGLDIAVSDTESTELVVARSYRKQIWGQEVEANLFRFWDIGSGGTGIGQLGTELFDVRIGRQQNEPIHAGIRWVIEQAAYDIVRDLTGAGSGCDAMLPELSRSARQPVLAAAAAPAARVPATAPATTETSPAAEVVATSPLPGPEPSGPRAVRLPGGRVLSVQDPSSRP